MENLNISECTDLNLKYNTKFLENVKILENQDMGGGNFILRVFSSNTKNGTVHPEAGQFYMIQLKNQIRILRRPISLHSVKYETGELEFLYKILGKGTEELSKFSPKDVINIQGPLGKGFYIEKDLENNTGNDKKNIVIVGGGIGLAPLKQLITELQKNYNNTINFIAGGRNKESLKILKNFDLNNERIRTVVCTDDGSLGKKANVVQMLKEIIEKGEKIDMIYSCGPHKVLELINEISNKENIPSQVSLEERMACGQGACVGCSVKTDSGMKKVCHDGPVFYSEVFRNGCEING